MAPPGTPQPPRGLTVRERSEFAGIVAELEALNLASTADSIVIGVLSRAIVPRERRGGAVAEGWARQDWRSRRSDPKSGGTGPRGRRGDVSSEPVRSWVSIRRRANACGARVFDVPMTYRRLDDGV